MGMAAQRIPSNEVRPGDIIIFGGPHLIELIEPYTHPVLGETAGIAKAADGWGITLIGTVRLDVVR